MTAYDAVVIGGSISGLSATLTLARALRKVVCIDLGVPCNRYAIESHNFVTHDGEKPLEIRTRALEQIKRYPTVEIKQGKVTNVSPSGDFFEIVVDNKDTFETKKVIFASGVNDHIEKAGVEGLKQFWGNSIITCPYCHGYEYANQRTGVYFTSLAVCKMLLPMINNWSNDITLFIDNDLFTSLDESFISTINKKKIAVHKSKVVKVIGEGYSLRKAITADGNEFELDVLYMMPPSTVNNKEILKSLGVTLDSFGLIKVDAFQKTNIPGVYASGDCSVRMRTLSVAAGQGTVAGSMVSHELCFGNWYN